MPDPRGAFTDSGSDSLKWFQAGPLRWGVWRGSAPGPASQTREKTRVYLEQGKQNKMCAFVNMWMTISCSGYKILHTEVAPGFRKEPTNDFHRALDDNITTFLLRCMGHWTMYRDTRYFIFQIRAPGGHDTTFIISTYTINKVKYNNYFITINHVCHKLKQREVIQARWS